MAIVLFLCFTGCSAYVTGVSRVCKVFPPNRSFLSPFGFGTTSKIALSNVTATFCSSVTAFVGPSGASKMKKDFIHNFTSHFSLLSTGSGKSTLAKTIIGMNPENVQGEVHLSKHSSGPGSVAYMDFLFPSRYDAGWQPQRLLRELCSSQQKREACVAALSAMQIPADVPVRRLVLSSLLLSTPCFNMVHSLLESKRKSFEVLLALGMAPGAAPHLLVLDEFLDKDVKSVRREV
jgi:hypothetical protein